LTQAPFFGSPLGRPNSKEDIQNTDHIANTHGSEAEHAKPFAAKSDGSMPPSLTDRKKLVRQIADDMSLEAGLGRAAKRLHRKDVRKANIDQDEPVKRPRGKLLSLELPVSTSEILKRRNPVIIPRKDPKKDPVDAAKDPHEAAIDDVLRIKLQKVNGLPNEKILQIRRAIVDQNPKINGILLSVDDFKRAGARYDAQSLIAPRQKMQAASTEDLKEFLRDPDLDMEFLKRDTSNLQGYALEHNKFMRSCAAMACFQLALPHRGLGQEDQLKYAQMSFDYHVEPWRKIDAGWKTAELTKDPASPEGKAKLKTIAEEIFALNADDINGNKATICWKLANRADMSSGEKRYYARKGFEFASKPPAQKDPDWRKEDNRVKAQNSRMILFNLLPIKNDTEAQVASHEAGHTMSVEDLTNNLSIIRQEPDFQLVKETAHTSLSANGDNLNGIKASIIAEMIQRPGLLTTDEKWDHAWKGFELAGKPALTAAPNESEQEANNRTLSLTARRSMLDVIPFT
jgi:hypothetical protein